MKLLDSLLEKFKKSSEDKLIKEEPVNQISNERQEKIIKQDYFSNNFNNILIHGRAGSGKTHLALEYYNNTPIKDKLFIAHGTCANNWKHHILGEKLLESIKDFNTLFNNYKLVIVDEPGGLVFRLPGEKKEKFINSIKLCIENPEQTVIIINPNPIPSFILKESLENINYILSNFHLILVGSSCYSDIEDSYLKDFDDIDQSYSQYSRDFYYYLVYEKEPDHSFVLKQSSESQNIFGV